MKRSWEIMEKEQNDTITYFLHEREKENGK